MALLIDDKDECEEFIKYAKSKSTDKELEELKDDLEFYNKMINKNKKRLLLS